MTGSRLLLAVPWQLPFAASSAGSERQRAAAERAERDFAGGQRVELDEFLSLAAK